MGEYVPKVARSARIPPRREYLTLSLTSQGGKRGGGLRQGAGGGMIVRSGWGVGVMTCLRWRWTRNILEF